jgi:hypothetical protein
MSRICCRDHAVGTRADFFTDYDSLDCLQQKCLVHLIRDLNDGLLADPFDKGLGVLCTKFGQLLRNIIATIDRFGLRTKYLKKHKQEVKQFFEETAGQAFQSTVARTLYKRMAKYGRELFTFLRVFTHAKNEGAFDGVNPVQDARIPRSREPGETYAYNLTQIRCILEPLPVLPKAVVAAACFAGLRRGEFAWARMAGLHMRISHR